MEKKQKNDIQNEEYIWSKVRGEIDTKMNEGFIRIAPKRLRKKKKKKQVRSQCNGNISEER